MKTGNVRPYNTKPEEPSKPTKLSQLFKETDDPVQRQKERDARFGRTSQNTSTVSGSFTK